MNDLTFVLPSLGATQMSRQDQMELIIVQSTIARPRLRGRASKPQPAVLLTRRGLLLEYTLGLRHLLPLRGVRHGVSLVKGFELGGDD